jgi:hypothetical protein
MLSATLHVIEKTLRDCVIIAVFIVFAPGQQAPRQVQK